ncbi:MAG: agmatine deiminase family protein [Alphaproteobacteria bacterium]|nr:agmatine deiminase family protein [Alphaproteobacteria bacterium]
MTLLPAIAVAGAAGLTAPGEYTPGQIALVASWPASLDASFVPLVGALRESGLPVWVCERDAETGASAVAALDAAGLLDARVYLEPCALDSIWMRDYGPLFLEDAAGRPVFGDPTYLVGRDQDDAFPAALGQRLAVPVVEVPLKLDGGNLLPDGEGGCVTTTQLLVRNPERDAVEAALTDTAGCARVIWLEPIDGERTGHVDVFLTFAGPGQALLGASDPVEDPDNAAALDRNAEALLDAGYDVRRVPMPPHGDLDGDTVEDHPTWLNGVLAEGDRPLWIVPSYAEAPPERRAEALAAFAAAMPEREVVEVPADALVTLGGALHCVTRVMPAPTWAPCVDCPGSGCSHGGPRSTWGLLLLAAIVGRRSKAEGPAGGGGSC